MNYFIKKDIKNKKIKTRFSPEPNGELHLGHLKCIYLNYFMSKYSNGNMILRFDDTNPINCNIKSVNKIIRDFKNIGIFKKLSKINFTSDYFRKLIIIAKIFIKKKFAYIEYNKIRIVSINKSEKIFKMMQYGKLDEKKAVLKANILTLTKNYNTKLNIMFRVIKSKKHYLKKNFFVFPTYNFSHCLCDYFDNIDISFCTKEFENNKFFYNWYLKKYSEIFNVKKIPEQIEFSKLIIKNVPLSKRQMLNLKFKKNLMTINSLLRRGISYKHLINFCKILSYSKKESCINFYTFNDFIIKSMFKLNIVKINFITNPKRVFFRGRFFFINKKKKSKKLILLNNINKITILFNNIIGKENIFKGKKIIFIEDINLRINEIIYVVGIGFFKKKTYGLMEVITF